MANLIRKRGSVKAKLSNFSKFLDEHVSKDIVSEFDIINLQERLNIAQNFIHEFESIQNDIELTSDDDQLENQYEERTEFETFYSLIAKAKQILSEFNVKSSLSGESSLHNRNRASDAFDMNAHKLAGIKLRPIELPKFSGSFDGWLEFADLYEALVHKNECLDNIQRFHYLRSSLQGGAAQEISALEFTSENYSVAWKALRDRYDNKRLLIFNHIQSIFNVEPTSKESSSKLREIIDYVSKHLHALQQLKQPTDKWDVLLIYMISSKLDTNTLREWENQKGDEVPTWEDFKRFIKARADTLETLAATRNENLILNQTSFAGFTLTH